MYSNEIKYIIVVVSIIILSFINIFIKTQNDALSQQYKHLICEKQCMDNISKKIMKEDFCLENSFNFCQYNSNINEIISNAVNKYVFKDLTMKLTNEATDLFKLDNVELKFSSNSEKNIYKMINDIMNYSVACGRVVHQNSLYRFF